jgi:DnaJ-class molecular chaperone
MGAILDVNDVRTKEHSCIGCDGKGWVQVIDPPVYELRVGSTNTDLGGPQTISRGTARAVTCPLCEGTGRREA